MVNSIFFLFPRPPAKDYKYSCLQNAAFKLDNSKILLFRKVVKIINQRTEGPESRTDGETLIFWD